MIVTRFSRLLQQKIGLDASSIGTSAIARAVQARLGACKLADTSAYWELASTSESELQKLVEEVVVPETWFFRDREAFTALGQLAQEDWQQPRLQGVVRLLSVPCSTGEEPYSMAMTLLDAGLAPERFVIDAVDISTRVLAFARVAEYGKNSFRGADFAFRDRHFSSTPQGYRVSPAVTQRVEFRQGNLFSGDALPATATYDAVFCRNLLIYFDRAGQDQAVQVLRSLLVPGGVLFVGPSESALLLQNDFVSLKMPLAFGFRERNAAERSAAAPPVAAPAPATAAPNRKPATAAPGPRRAAANGAHAKKTAPAVAEVVAADDGLAAASLLANQGRLVEAAQACDTHIRKTGASAAALHLMGLICAASDDLQGAIQHYRKALYLDPNHHDTLLHLGLLLEQQGDVAAARLLRERMLRVQKAGTP